MAQCRPRGDWPARPASTPAFAGRDRQQGGYGKLVRVNLPHELRDRARCDGPASLTAPSRKDLAEAGAFLASHAAQRRQTTRDRI
jgi:hypothetical protein